MVVVLYWLLRLGDIDFRARLGVLFDGGTPSPQEDGAPGRAFSFCGRPKPQTNLME